MNMENITVTEISNVVTIYSDKSRHNRMVNRGSYGLSFCKEGQITYIQNGSEYISNKDCAIILPKGGTYFIKRDKAGEFPVINFDCLDFLCDTITVIPVRNAEELISDYERMKKLFGFDGSRTKIFSIFYGMLHKLCSDDVPRELRSAVRLISNDYSDMATIQ